MKQLESRLKCNREKVRASSGRSGKNVRTGGRECKMLFRNWLELKTIFKKNGFVIKNQDGSELNLSTVVCHHRNAHACWFKEIWVFRLPQATAIRELHMHFYHFFLLWVFHEVRNIESWFTSHVQQDYLPLAQTKNSSFSCFFFVKFYHNFSIFT